jgi:DHA3 family macrolide efflux protein-like MFS transporter
MHVHAWDARRWRPLFFTIWGGQVFSLLGSRLVQFALVWWLTKETGSATVLATATIVALLPQVFLGPFAGALVDRWDRRRVMIIADATIALSVVALALLFAFGRVHLWHVYTVMFVRSLGGAFHWPAMQASTTLMVSEEHYSRVAGLNQSLQGIANIVSPPLGALLLSLLPMHGVIAVDVLTAAIAVTPLLFIAIPQPHVERGAAPQASFLRSFAAGFRLLLGWPGMLMVVAIAAMLNFLFGPAFSLLPLSVTHHFHGGAYHLAGLQTAMGVGMIIGGLLLTAWGGFRRRIATSMFGIIVLGVATFVFGLTPGNAFPIGVGALFVAGLMLPVANGSIMATMQATVPPEMQGRVFTLLGSASAGMMPLGLAIAGPLADRFGAMTWFVAGGIAAVVLGSAAFLVPAIMTLEQNEV